jgi:hypothetical protein
VAVERREQAYGWLLLLACLLWLVPGLPGADVITKNWLKRLRSLAACGSALAAAADVISGRQYHRDENSSYSR